MGTLHLGWRRTYGQIRLVKAEECNMENRILIRSGEPDLRERLFGDLECALLTLDEETEASIALESSRRLRTAEFADLIQLGVQWGAPSGLALVAQWLYERLK